MKRVIYKPFINKTKLNKNGKTLVMVEAYQGGKRKYFQHWCTHNDQPME